MPPAQQRLAAGDLVVGEIDQRLVVDFKAVLRQRGAQIALEFAATVGLGFHRRIEESMRPAAGCLRRIHCQIGTFQQAEQVGAVARRDRDADRGIAGKLMAVAVERRPQRLIDPRHQHAHILVALHVMLQDGELVAAETGNEVAGADRLAQPFGDALEELVADQVAE